MGDVNISLVTAEDAIYFPIIRANNSLYVWFSIIYPNLRQKEATMCKHCPAYEAVRQINHMLVPQLHGDFTFFSTELRAGTVSKEMAHLLTHLIILWINAHVIIMRNVEDPQLINGPGGTTPFVWWSKRDVT